MMTPTEFKTRFPEFTTVADARVQVFLDEAEPMFDVERWESFYTQGLGNLVAHELALATPSLKIATMSGAADGKTSKKVGAVAVTYAAELITAAAKNPYMRTSYGQKYSELRRLVGIGAVAV